MHPPRHPGSRKQILTFAQWTFRGLHIPADRHRQVNRMGEDSYHDVNGGHHVCGVDAFISNWVAHIGAPCAVTTDRGTQNTSSLWASTCTHCTRPGIQHILTTASYTVKKAFRYSRPQPGCHVPNSPWVGIMTSYINYSCLGRVW
jgi:hypothetical protein